MLKKTNRTNKHPHGSDIQTLLHVCNAHNVSIAENVATANPITSDEPL
ncbi:MAG: hypothetical protein SXV54_11755 [Chloroflexota bacterium]|nr:hypothetical protein [Chloroflexota bacterium]